MLFELVVGVGSFGLVCEEFDVCVFELWVLCCSGSVFVLVEMVFNEVVVELKMV